MGANVSVGGPSCVGGPFRGCCAYAEIEPETTIRAKRAAPSIWGIVSWVAHSRLVVSIGFDNISLTFAPGIRKRFQSSPNALETCYFCSTKTRPRLSSEVEENRDGC